MTLMHNQETISGMRGMPRKAPFVMHERAQRYNRHKCYK